MKSPEKVIILKPRLDVSFKQGPVPETRSPLIKIRSYWRDFVEKLQMIHEFSGDSVEVIERPLWQFSFDVVEKLAKTCDRIYIPHKQKTEMNVGENALYYMQTVYPEKFSIDRLGWGYSMSCFPLLKNTIDSKPSVLSEMNGNQITTLLELVKKVETNSTKFKQPQENYNRKEEYRLFVCQLPHDETIKHHSKIGVVQALEMTLEQCLQEEKFLLIKGHPANLSAMQEMQEIANNKKYRNMCQYTDKHSLSSCLSNASLIYTVNSGVGLEALAIGQNVIRFGDAEYNEVTPHFNDTPYKYTIRSKQINFLYEYNKILYDTTKETKTFKKVLNV